MLWRSWASKETRGNQRNSVFLSLAFSGNFWGMYIMMPCLEAKMCLISHVLFSWLVLEWTLCCMLYAWYRWYHRLTAVTYVTYDLQLAQKYDQQKEEELRLWIHEVTGHQLPAKFMDGLKDGVVLCEWVLCPIVVRTNRSGVNSQDINQYGLQSTLDRCFTST